MAPSISHAKRRVVAVLLGAALAGCGEPEEGGWVPRTSAPGTTPTGPVETTPTTGTTSDTGTTTTPLPPESFDCATIPDTLGDPVLLEAPRGYNDVVFDDAGAMVGWDGAVLRRASAPDAFDVLAPMPMVFKLARLPGGDLVGTLADTDQVIRVDPAGSNWPIATSLDGYGVIVGSDGLVYVGTSGAGATPNAIVRIDPDTMDADVWLDLAATPPRDIAFSRDETVLYYGTQNGGNVYKVPLDANHDPIGPPERIATLAATWHDTLQVDACGNLYVGGLFGLTYYRIGLDRQPRVLAEFTWDQWAHGFEWGDAAGGWDDLSVYMVHPDVGDRVTERFAGVPGRAWDGALIGAFTL